MSSIGRSSMARSSRIERERVVVRQNYFWPDQQLNFWVFVMLGTGGTLVGVFASFLQQQQNLGLPVPWIIPYGITVGALTIFYVLVLVALTFQGRLLPGVVMVGCFILLVLYITGVIETAIQLFGPASDISSRCGLLTKPSKGPSVQMLAWLQQSSVCQSWDAAFAFWIVGAIFFVWMIVIGVQVSQGQAGG